MWDMDEEHRALFDEEQVNFIDKVTYQFERIINILYELPSFQYTCFAVDVFMLKDKKPEDVMKDIIFNYYKLFCEKESLSVEREFLDNKLFGNHMQTDSLKSVIKYALGIDETKINEMPIELKSKFRITLKESINNLNNIFYKQFPRLYTIPKECKAFYSKILQDVYLGIIFSGTYLVYDEYCILIIQGTSE